MKNFAFKFLSPFTVLNDHPDARIVITKDHVHVKSHLFPGVLLNMVMISVC